MTTYKKQLKDKNGNTIYPDVGLNLDDVVYSDDPTEPIGEVVNPFDYSTTETRIGTWIDGKPLYRKTISFGNLPSNPNQNATKDHGISNLGYVANIYGSVVNSLGEYYPLPLMFRGGDSNYNVQCWVNSTKILMSTTQDRSNYSAIVTLEYTKSTD